MLKKKTLGLLLTATLIATLATGCSSSGSKTEETKAPVASSGTTTAAPTTLKVLAIIFGQLPNADNNLAKADIEKRGNIKLDIDFVPADAYSDKLSISLTSGANYDLVLFTDPFNKYQSFIKSGAFQDLTPYIKGKKNLEFIPEQTWKNTESNGLRFGIPRPRGLYGGGEANIILRKDWLDQYNLQVPKTLDEFTNVLKVFKEKDPAGGGKTIPYIVTNTIDAYTQIPPFGMANPIAFSFGLPNAYKIEGGKASAVFQQPEYKSYLEWLRQAYKDKLIDKDAPVQKSSQGQDKFFAGVAGSYVGQVQHMNPSDSSTYGKLLKTDPNAKLVAIPELSGPKGAKGAAVITGYYGLWVVPQSVAKDKVQKIVDFLDFSASEENDAFYQTGVVGVHSSGLKNGIAEKTPEQEKAYANDRIDVFVMENRYDPYYYTKSTTNPDVVKTSKSILDAISKIGIANPFLPYISETAGKNPDILKPLTAAATKYVMGEGEYDSVQKEIDVWAAGTGETILKEYLDQYSKDHP
ncbi:extracellular solute-binding protein [Paenibacillus psychroresistens]|uniref:Extracellular solute-binding protein n=1 Tax=Paenibacillus psychroresistens TaxID=1778678 RepID=A0A6B8RRJ9_9BACL|nr:extracellular solute-binding protein [Paenibacillus psychroresistens]QGQ98434.1 extracellular solute-binding protein [Paenibacillus psychroresistens]